MPVEHELVETLRALSTKLTFALQWERTQKERLLEEQSEFRSELRRLQDRVTDLELQLAERRHESAPS
jgi:hypothetical protein